MSCVPCVEKWTRYYLRKGFDRLEAEHMAKKLVKRLEKRLRREGLSYIPLYLLEQGQGVELFTAKPRAWRIAIANALRKWARILLMTNWVATFRWRRWIGFGYNPDYTQACTQGTCTMSNACVPKGALCGFPEDCIGNGCATPGSCGCPAPLPNSGQVSGCTVTCSGTGSCGGCLSKRCTSPSCIIVNCTTGTCGYNCNAGYTWNGSACVPVGVAAQPQGDGLVWIGILKKLYRHYSAFLLKLVHFL